MIVQYQARLAHKINTPSHTFPIGSFDPIWSDYELAKCSNDVKLILRRNRLPRFAS